MSEPSGPPHPAGRTLFWAVLILGLGLDLASKSAAFAHHQMMQGDFGSREPLELYRVSSLTLSIVRELNTGMAFGLLQDAPTAPFWLAIARALALAFVLWFAARTPARAWVRRIALGLLGAGAAGNLADNLFEPHHAVRDFILFTGRDWSLPAFNLADVWVTVGATMLIWRILRRPRHRPAAAS